MTDLTAAPTADSCLLRLIDVHRDFGGVRAVAGATFDVPRAKITGLIGPNGAGKSTVVNIVSGIMRPASGAIEFDNRVVTGWPAYRLARLGIARTFQLATEFSRLTVLENLLVAAPEQRGESFSGAMLGPRWWRVQQDAHLSRARGLLGQFGLGDKENDYAANLSLGQKKVLEILRALMRQPKLLILDEPLAGVNPTLAQKIIHYLEHLRSEGLTMLLVEHDLGAVDRLCDPVVVMAQGKVLAQGSLKTLRRQKEVQEAYLIG